MALLNVTAYDKQFYEENLKDFLPDKFIDCHNHIWLDAFKDKKRKEHAPLNHCATPIPLM